MPFSILTPSILRNCSTSKKRRGEPTAVVQVENMRRLTRALMSNKTQRLFHLSSTRPIAISVIIIFLFYFVGLGERVFFSLFCLFSFAIYFHFFLHRRRRRRVFYVINDLLLGQTILQSTGHQRDSMMEEEPKGRPPLFVARFLMRLSSGCHLLFLFLILLLHFSLSTTTQRNK